MKTEKRPVRVRQGRQSAIPQQQKNNNWQICGRKSSIQKKIFLWIFCAIQHEEGCLSLIQGKTERCLWLRLLIFSPQVNKERQKAAVWNLYLYICFFNHYLLRLHAGRVNPHTYAYIYNLYDESSGIIASAHISIVLLFQNIEKGAKHLEGNWMDIARRILEYVVKVCPISCCRHSKKDLGYFPLRS